MIENIKAVNNPLTIIAIFAALAEVAGTIALKLVSENLQVTFIWFVMLFPALLVLLFFITLNFNPKVLYAPSDFRDEENFLSIISGASRLSIDLKDVERQLEVVKGRIIDEALKQIDVAGDKERARLISIVNDNIRSVQEKVETTRESAEEVAFETPLNRFSPKVQEKILQLLSSEDNPISLAEIRQKLSEEGINIDDLYWNMRSLRKQGLVEKFDGANIWLYKVRASTKEEKRAK